MSTAGPSPDVPPPPPPGQPPPGPPSYGAPPPGQPAYGAPPPGPPPSYGGPPSRMSPSEERTWGGAAHWSALIGAFVALAFLGPLLVLLLKGGDSPWVRRQAVESLNFQLTILLAAAVSFLLVFVLVGFVLLPLVGLAWLVFTIVGSVKVSSGQDYRYPMTLRLVR